MQESFAHLSPIIHQNCILGIFTGQIRKTRSVTASKTQNYYSERTLYRSTQERQRALEQGKCTNLAWKIRIRKIN